MTPPLNYNAFRPHPWHGLSVGQAPPSLLRAFIEITPSDSMKYEIDKLSGYMRLDRPQRSSSLSPTPYGFVPRTYCGAHVAALSPTSVKGDEDPLDICVIAEQPVDRGEVLLDARVVGGVQMIDGGEADDKIIAVLRHPPLSRQLVEHGAFEIRGINWDGAATRTIRVYDRAINAATRVTG